MLPFFHFRYSGNGFLFFSQIDRFKIQKGEHDMKKHHVFKWLFIIGILSLLFLVGCSDNDASEHTNDETSGETTEQREDSGNFPLQLTDSTGHTVTIDKKPEKIIPLIPSNTEILFALGLGEKVIAVTENDNYPEEVLELEKVGDAQINVEKIISLEPDLVLAHESGKNMAFDAFEQLIDAGINVYFVSDAQSIEETFASIEEIGKVTGAEEEAQQLVEEMKKGFEEISAIAEQIPGDERKSVFFEISGEPEIYTGGAGTFFNELIELINAKNAAGSLEGWAKIDPEAIVDLNPDVIITLYGEFSTEDPVEQVKNRDGFGDVNAVKNGQIFDLDDDIVSRPGPRLVDGAKALANLVYPEYFNE